MSIEVATRDGLCVLRLARAEKKNALTFAMYSALASALAAAEADPAVHAVLFTGEPGVFCAGNDVGDFGPDSPKGAAAPGYQFMQAVLAVSKPLLAAVDGSAVGIGATLLLHCDLVFVSDRAQLHFPFASLGVTPEFCSSLLLPRRVGLQQAARLMLLGEPVAGPEAVRLGLAIACVAPEAVLPRAMAAAATLIATPAGAARVARRLMREHEGPALQAALAAECAAFEAQLSDPATQAALRAALTKRRGTS